MFKFLVNLFRKSDGKTSTREQKETDIASNFYGLGDKEFGRMKMQDGRVDFDHKGEEYTMTFHNLNHRDDTDYTGDGF